jgi:hypothetical protein
VKSGALRAYRDGTIRLSTAKLPPGRYVAGVVVSAWANPDRTLVKASRVFTIPKK